MELCQTASVGLGREAAEAQVNGSPGLGCNNDCILIQSLVKSAHDEQAIHPRSNEQQGGVTAQTRPAALVDGLLRYCASPISTTTCEYKHEFCRRLKVIVIRQCSRHCSEVRVKWSTSRRSRFVCEF